MTSNDIPPAAAGALRRLAAALTVDLSPWRGSRDFRLLWSAGAITVFGSFLTLVAVPLQLKQLTGSISLYNESLGTTSDLYEYDRLKGREVPQPAPVNPWELTAGH